MKREACSGRRLVGRFWCVGPQRERRGSVGPPDAQSQPCERRNTNASLTSIERLVKFYESWHTAEPGKGYDTKAAEWRAKLAEGPEAKGNEDGAGTNTEDTEQE